MSLSILRLVTGISSTISSRVVEPSAACIVSYLEASMDSVTPHYPEARNPMVFTKNSEQEFVNE